MRVLWMVVLALPGCAGKDVCNLESLSAEVERAGAATTSAERAKIAREALASACGESLPPELRTSLSTPATAAPACAAGADPATVAGRTSAFSACNVDSLGPVAAYSWADGDPLLATSVLLWMSSVALDPALSTKTALLVRGEPTWTPPATDAPELPVGAPAGATPAAPTLFVTPARIHGSAEAALAGGQFAENEPLAGHAFPTWAVPGLDAKAGTVAAVDASITVGALKRLVASVVPPGEPLVLIGRVDAGVALGSITLAAGSDAPRVALADTATTAELFAALAKTGGSGSFSLTEDRCRPGAPGMVCVPGGPVSVGDDTLKSSAPRREIELSTFWIDEKEATRADYAPCAAKGYCRALGGAADSTVATGLTWDDARRYCSFVGKRLPTEWEWERAASSGLGAALLDGPAEWTGTLAKAADQACTEGCTGRDPLGPCDGWGECGVGLAVVRGAAANPAARAGRLMASADRNTGVRCASSEPWLTAFPPVQFTNPRAELPVPPAPSEAHRALAWGIEQDNLEDKGICGEEVRKNWKEKYQKGGHSTTFCRDPYSYVVPNESRTSVWRRYIENLGGAYIGVASDTNYNMVALARSEWAWMMDYDPNVVRGHKLVRAAVLASETPEQFVSLFDDAKSAEMEKAIDAAWPEEAEILKSFYFGYRNRLETYYTKILKPNPQDAKWGWLANPDQYAYIRTLTQQGRIIPTGGDMLGAKSMASIAAACRELGVPVRIYYTSNAPTAWGGTLLPEYRKNVGGLPMDELSLVIATYNTGAFRQEDYWHYQIHGGLHEQARIALPGYGRAQHLIWDRIPTDDGDTTVLGVRSSP